MRSRPRSRLDEDRARGTHHFVFLAVFLALVVYVAEASLHAQQKNQLSKHPRQLDRGIVWHRDPATGELNAVANAGAPGPHSSESAAEPHPLQVLTQMVPVTCIVSAADGSALPGLRREDFRIYEDGVTQPVAYFDASTAPASVALVIDASPSVLRDSEEMKRAAGALVDALAPLDQTAVVDFSAHTYLQLAFSDVREQARRAITRINVRELFGDVGGSNIYEAVYLAANELFLGRTGRKAILLLTDGQDSGLGLSYDPATAAPQPGKPPDRLTFDDVARKLVAEDIQIFAVSTESRPKVMTPEWLGDHKNATLLSPDPRRLDIPAYTLYLAELVRRSGGELHFLRESKTMADTFRKIAEKIRAEYSLGFYPSARTTGIGASPGWHSLRVEVYGDAGAQVSHRAAYYVPAAQ
jgi:Ca-activated chloride channel family protein